MRTIVITLALVALSASNAEGWDQIPDVRPTTHDARVATRIATQMFSDLVDGKLHVSRRCPPRGKRARVCIARISGPVPERLRVTVVAQPDGNYRLQARRIR